MLAASNDLSTYVQPTEPVDEIVEHQPSEPVAENHEIADHQPSNQTTVIKVPVDQQNWPEPVAEVTVDQQSPIHLPSKPVTKSVIPKQQSPAFAEVAFSGHCNETAGSARELARANLQELCGPITAVKTRTRKRKAEKATVLTGSPYKQILEEKQVVNRRKDDTATKKSMSCGKKSGEPRSRPTSQARQQGGSRGANGKRSKKSSPDKDDDNGGRKGAKGKGRKSCQDNDSNNKDDDIIPCAVCQVRRCDDKDNSSWIQCQDCMNWFHNECQGIEENYSDDNFWCLECE